MCLFTLLNFMKQGDEFKLNQFKNIFHHPIFANQWILDHPIFHFAALPMIQNELARWNVVLNTIPLIYQNLIKCQLQCENQIHSTLVDRFRSELRKGDMQRWRGVGALRRKALHLKSERSYNQYDSSSLFQS